MTRIKKTFKLKSQAGSLSGLQPCTHNYSLPLLPLLTPRASFLSSHSHSLHFNVPLKDTSAGSTELGYILPQFKRHRNELPHCRGTATLDKRLQTEQKLSFNYDTAVPASMLNRRVWVFFWFKMENSRFDVLTECSFLWAAFTVWLSRTLFFRVLLQVCRTAGTSRVWSAPTLTL